MKDTEQKVSTEELILEAAVREFTEKGFAGARTTSIAEAAGVTHAMLHYYFRTKEKLYDRVLESRIQLVGNMLTSALGEDSLPVRQRVEHAVSSHFDFLQAHPDFPQYVLSVMRDRPETLQQLREQVVGRAEKIAASLQAQIDAEAARGECRQVDARMLMLDILSLNIFPFLAGPLVELFLGETADISLERRKQENITTILCKLRP